MSVYAGPADWWTDGTNAGRYHISSKGVVQTGLVYHIDSAVTQSYPGTGTTWTDLTSNPINATINSATFTNEFGGTLTTSNTSTFATIGTQSVSSKLSLTQNFSIEQIFKPTGYQAANYFGLTNQLLAKGTASTYNYATQLTSDTSVSFVKRTSPEGLQYHTFNVPSMLNKVNVLTFVITNTTVTCYMNGNLIGSLSIIGSAIAAVEGDPTYISVDLAGNDECVLKGNYYSCKIYNIALSDIQVRQNFNALRGRFGV